MRDSEAALGRDDHPLGLLSQDPEGWCVPSAIGRTKLPLWVQPPLKGTGRAGEYLNASEQHRNAAALVWSAGSGRPVRRHPRSACAGLLWSFVRLARASDERILAFAQRHGLLGLCGHGWPWMHGPDIATEDAEPLALMDVPQSAGRVGRSCADDSSTVMLEWAEAVGLHAQGFEPIVAWRRFAGQAGAMLRARTALASDRTISADDWARLLDAARHHDSVFGQHPPMEIVRHMLKIGSNRWLLAGGVTFGVFERGGAFGCGPVAGSLFGELAVQLASALTHRVGFLVCEACGAPFRPGDRDDPNAAIERRRVAQPKGLPVYCALCRRSARHRDRQRAYRARGSRGR